jgi:hypothetical protein
MIGDITWRIGHGSEKFRLISLDDRCVGFDGTEPQFDGTFLCAPFVMAYLSFPAQVVKIART